MDAMGIDVQAVSPVPMQYHYWAERAVAEKIVAAANDGIAAICASRPERLVGLGTIAMQFPELAAAQLEHAMRELHLKGVIVSTAVNGLELADPRFEVFWARAEELGAVGGRHADKRGGSAVGGDERRVTTAGWAAGRGRALVG